MSGRSREPRLAGLAEILGLREKGGEFFFQKFERHFLFNTFFAAYCLTARGKSNRFRSQTNHLLFL